MDRGLTLEQRQEIERLIKQITETDPNHAMLVVRAPVTEDEEIEDDAPIYLTGYGSLTAIRQLLEIAEQQLTYAMTVGEVAVDQYGV